MKYLISEKVIIYIVKDITKNIANARDIIGEKN